MCLKWPTRRIARKDSYCFLTSFFSYRFLASYSPKFFKIICSTCIWWKFVDTSFLSSQKGGEGTKYVLAEKRLCGRLTTSCGQNLEAIGSDAIFCEVFSLSFLREPNLLDRKRRSKSSNSLFNVAQGGTFVT